MKLKQRRDKMKVTVIDGVEYVRKSDVKSGPTKESKKQIVILQRGWVVVGDMVKSKGPEQELRNASVIRTWGTKKGLGEIALNGPTTTTVLDACGTVRFHEMAVVCRMDVEESKWS
jgi:hypothetical protein